MVSVSPRPPDLDSDEEPEVTDPRFSLGFRSISLDSSGYSDHEVWDDARPFAGTPDPAASRRRRRQRQIDGGFQDTALYRFQTVADGDAFRLAVIQPGTGTNPIQCNLLWESSNGPSRKYCCLSYAWESVHRDAAILCDGFRFPVTSNLLRALQSLRKPKTPLIIWVDQVCINQDDDTERGHQVSIMKHIFNKAHKIYVWLGDEDARTAKLCEYAKRMRRSSDDSPRNVLNRLLSQRELKDATLNLLRRPWFQRVWVIPEVALSRHTSVACGRSHITWDNLVRLIRDVPIQSSSGFDKQAALLGNPRQRIAIIHQMMASQKESRAHTDITQLLILAKSSKATDVRDMIYAFYGLTHVTTFPDYTRPVERLYIDIVQMYISSIQWETSYAKWHELTETHKTFQLMSILYSAGALHQHYELPSWVPDFTYSWHLAPVWCKTIPNFVTGSSKDDWTSGIRSEYRAGGENVETFEILEGSRGMHLLRVSALIFDTIVSVNELTPASTPDTSQLLATSPTEEIWDSSESPTLRYGRHFFTTVGGHVGIGTPGIVQDDVVAILVGGDVPVVLRPCPDRDGKSRAFQLLCECYVQSPAVMQGNLFASDWTLADDIVLI